MSQQSSFFKSILNALPNKVIVPLFLLGGVAVGLGLYTTYASRALTYLGAEPSACVNCHIMTVSYQSWSRSSHANWTTCGDCHVPQYSRVAEMMFKAQDGLFHSAQFTLHREPPAPRPRAASIEVIQQNCVRCHTQLNTEFVSAGKATFTDIQHGRQRTCWDCHRHVPHTTMSGLASAPHAIAPLPSASVAPDWLKNLIQ